MNIIGISGFDNVITEKRRYWPGLSEREYRMCQGQDSAAALVRDGIVIAAAAEERFTGEKHTGAFPKHAIAYCLRAGGIGLEDIDVLAHGFEYPKVSSGPFADPISRVMYRDVYSPDAVLKTVQKTYSGFPASRFMSVPHHLAHAASVFYTSGWNDGLIVVSDGMGEMHGTSVWHAVDGNLRRVGGVAASNSLGILYSLVTHHLGFEFNADEYKIMGLAPYGDPRAFREFFENAVILLPGGGVRIPILHANRTRADRESYAATREMLARALGPARDAAQPIDATHRDIAAGMQECLNRAVLHVCGTFARATGARRLMLAGGVAMNCSANGTLDRSGLFDEVFVCPASGDDGTALGAALHASVMRDVVPRGRMRSAYLGPQYSETDVAAALRRKSGEVRARNLHSASAAAQHAARMIADGKVLAWYRGRMEFGQRALGNRSILGDPAHPQMRGRINAMVKKREAFRPFAPAASRDEAARCFEIEAGREYPFMTSVVKVREEYRERLPAITHVDGTARLQTVDGQDNPDFHELLKQLGAITGLEMVLNTSFNVKGQPIVNTPDEAMDTFLGTGIDALFLENWIVERIDPASPSIEVSQ